MSIESLFNHSVQVYREPDPLANRDDTGHVPTVPEPVSTAPISFNARPQQRWMGDLQDKGAGEQQNRLRTWFLHKNIDVVERDVLLVTAGEQTGEKWLVVSMTPVTGRQQLHHKECNCEKWVGNLG